MSIFKLIFGEKKSAAIYPSNLSERVHWEWVQRNRKFQEAENTVPYVTFSPVDIAKQVKVCYIGCGAGGEGSTT